MLLNSGAKVELANARLQTSRGLVGLADHLKGWVRALGLPTCDSGLGGSSVWLGYH